jgi:uridine phosphorylase
LVELQNEYLQELNQDTLYHLNLDNRTFDLPRMFGDVRFVVMGGCSRRMRRFAQFIRQELPVDLPAGVDLVNITDKANRYAMFKVGPVISVSVRIESLPLPLLS